MGKHGTPVSQSSVISHFKKHGYENIPLDDFQKQVHNDCIFLQFTKFINPDHRRGAHIDIWMACGHNYSCEYRRGQKYVNRANDDPEDPRLWNTNHGINPISFEIHITGKTLPIPVVNNVIKDSVGQSRYYTTTDCGIVGITINLKRVGILLNKLDRHRDESVPKVRRYFSC